MDKEVKSLNDFEYVSQVTGWCLHNVKNTSMEEDDKFFFPPKIFHEKIGNCIDIAFLIHLWCEEHNVANRICQVCFEYRNMGKTIVNSNGHVVCVCREPLNHGMWTVEQTSGIKDRVNDPFFVYEPSLEKAIEKFAKAYLPFLVGKIREIRPGIEVTGYYYTILGRKQVDAIERRYHSGIVNNKQKFFHQLMEECDKAELKDIPK